MGETDVLDSEIQRKILKYLRKVYPKAIIWKTHEDSIYGIVGMPDIFFAYNNRVFFFEVKRPGELASQIQQYMLRKLNSNGVHSSVVYSVVDVERVLTKEFK